MRIYIVDLSMKQFIFSRFAAILRSRAESVFVPGFQPPYPPIDAHDVVVLTGSEYSILEDAPWLPSLMDWARAAYEAGNPMLGVCFGHQLIFRSLHGLKALARAKTPEMTFVPIEILKPHPIFAGLPNPFVCFSAHYDEVVQIPEGCESIARSEQCANQAVRFNDRLVMGLQFHPEIEPDLARTCIPPEKDRLATYGLTVEEFITRIPATPQDTAKILTNFVDWVERSR